MSNPTLSFVCRLCTSVVLLAVPLRAQTAAPTSEAEVVTLFDGSSLDAWRVKPDGWVIEEDGSLGRRKGGGYAWTKARFGDFVLELDFKVGPKTNSGVFIRTADLRKVVQTGIEVQILDSHGKASVGKHDCGAIYDCLAPSKNAVKAPGEWNSMTVTCRGSKIQVVLNGEQVIDMDLAQWTEPSKNPDGSKNKFHTAYKDMPREGHIGFQDHGKPVWYRNVRVRKLGK